MAWTALNTDFAVNDSTATIVKRASRFTGFTEGVYRTGDDPLPNPSNHGRAYGSFDERVADSPQRGGCRVVNLPDGVTYEEAVSLIRCYGRI